MLMHPSPPKREENSAERVDMWQDKMRRLEAHGDEFNLGPLFKINALRMLRGVVEQGQRLCEET